MRQLLKDGGGTLDRQPARERAFGEDGRPVAARGLSIDPRESGAVSGALNDSNDPDRNKREKHADSYYKEVRNRNTDAEVARVSASSGIDEETVRRVYDHVFVKEHDLSDGTRRFDPDYDMAQSWQRLSTGDGVQEHDVVLLRHEDAEARLMEQGMSYEAAHEAACRMGYDYTKALIEWKRKRGDR